MCLSIFIATSINNVYGLANMNLLFFGGLVFIVFGIMWDDIN